MSQNPEHTDLPETPENQADPVTHTPEEEAAQQTARDTGGDDGSPEGGHGDNHESGPVEGDHADGYESSPEDDVLRLEAELASTHDKLLRAIAETENVRRRAQREKEDTARYSVSNFARDLVAVADNLRRALDSVDDAARKENPAVENLMIGIEMTERELLTAFERNHIRRMDPIGQPFDPHIHEAMFEYDDAGHPAGTVGQVIETGYMIHDRPLRPAKVGVTKGGPKAPVPAEAEVEAPASKPPTALPAGESGDSSGASAYEGRTGEPGEHIDEEL